eukprot:gene5215-5591_t
MGKETSPLNNPFIYWRRWLTLLLTWLIFSQASPNLSQQQINALVDFYYATNGDSWRYFPSNTTNPWNVTNPHPNPCQEKWQGVTCSCPTNRCTVIKLELNHRNLSGTLPSSLGDLSTITLFNIDNNHVGGSIPTSVKSLKALTTWVTGSNNLTGSVPEAFGSLLLLSFINMPNNLITYLPEAIYNNTNLRGLFLSNNLIYGTISPKIGNWRKIEVLSLDNNQFYSTIPVSIGNLISLTSLELSRNSLNGSLPSSIGNCNNLTRFVMNYNPITGTLPDSIGNLKNLRTLVIHYNQFFGSLPDSLGGLTKLNILDLGGNLFTGTLPSSFNNLEAMIELHLCPGTFHGPVTFIQSLRYISSLELCYNFFSGNLGALFHNNSKLLHIFELSFGVNQFTGSLPVLENSTITIYDAHKNYLSGNIPDNKHFLTHIYYFEIAENYVTGSLPQNIFESSHIVNINFSLNLFTGILPFPENTSQTINQISLGYNFLTGTISENIGLARFMVSFSVQNNGFTGTIPQGLRHCGPLQTLYLNNNHFIGSIDVLLNQILEYNEYYEGKNISSLVRRLASWMKHVISTPLLPLTEESEQSVHRWVLFPKLKLTTQWTSSLIIIVAIGGIFPPVAMIGCFACIVVIYEQEWIIGKLIEESQRKNQLWIIQRLEDDCKDISNSLQFSIPASLIISCFLFAYILFDTIGDTDGWKVGLIEGVIMVAVPLLLYGGYWIWTKRIVLGSLLDTTGKDIKGADGERPTVELNPMRNNDSVHITGSSLLSV